MEWSSILNKLSELKIELDIRGDINLNNLEFNTSMISGSSKENEVVKDVNRYTRYKQGRKFDDLNKKNTYKTYFTPTIPITYNNLVNSKLYNIGSSSKSSDYIPKNADFIRVFSDLGNMTRLIRFIVGEKKLKPITINEAKELGFIEQNIDLILSIYFDKNNVLTLKGRKYYIHSFDWPGQFEYVQKPPSKTFSKITGKTTGKIINKPYYKINITLYVLNEESNKNPVEVKQLGCKIRRNKINEDLYKLGFIKQKPSNVITKKIKYTTVINPLVEKSGFKPKIKPSLNTTRKTEYKRYKYDNKNEDYMKKRLKEIEEQQRLMREREKIRRRLNQTNSNTNKTRKRTNEPSTSQFF
jgi:hypothetical protein